MIRGSNDVRLQLNAANIEFLKEAGAVATGFELIAENVIANPDLYSSLPNDVPISLHSVTLFPVSIIPVDVGVFRRAEEYLRGRVVDLVSIHLAKSILHGKATDRLIPIPYSARTLDSVGDSIKSMQEALGRQILVENISEYFSNPQNEMEALEFLGKLAHRTGCGLLLDLTNLEINAKNYAYNSAAIQLARLPSVKEVHVAGGSLHDGVEVDSHDTDISSSTIDMLTEFYRQSNDTFVTVLERDQNIGNASVIVSELTRIHNALTSQSVRC